MEDETTTASSGAAGPETAVPASKLHQQRKLSSRLACKNGASSSSGERLDSNNFLKVVG